MKPSAVPPANPIPKYVLLAETLRQRIARGEWPAGHCLPSLHEMAASFGVARLTARQAVQQLVQEGLLAARQGQGTFVTGQPAPRKTIQVQTSLQALSDLYVESPPEIRTIREDRAAEPPPGRGSPGTRYVSMKRVHADAGVPYCVITIHIDAALFARARKRFRTEAAIPLLVEMEGGAITRAQQTLTVGHADAETAELLGIAAHAPVAFVERTFAREDGHVVYFAEVTYRGEAVKLEIALTV